MTYISTQPSDCSSSRNLETRSRISIFSLIGHMLHTKQQRARLSRLGDAALCDIGITRQQAIDESKRSVWDVPANWRN